MFRLRILRTGADAPGVPHQALNEHDVLQWWRPDSGRWEDVPVVYRGNSDPLVMQVPSPDPEDG